MAKFCIYCGRPLKDGEVCSCRQQMNRTQPPEDTARQTVAAASSENSAPERPVDGGQDASAHSTAQAAGQRTAFTQESAAASAAPPVPASAAAAYFRHLWDFMLRTLKAPASVLGAFAVSGDQVTAFGTIVFSSLFKALFVITVFSHFNSALSGFFRRLPYIGAYLTKDTAAVSFPLGRIFLTVLLTDFGLFCLLGAILLLVGKVFFRIGISYQNTLCIAAAKSVAAMPFLVLGILCALVNVRLGIAVVLLSVIFKFLFTVLASEGIFSDRNRMVYILLISFILLAVCTYGVLRLTLPAYLPDSIKNLSDTVGQITSAGGNLSNLL